MRVEVDIRKSLEQNASDYFEKAKKDKRKLEGALRVVEQHELMLTKPAKEPAKPKLRKVVRREWFEKFRWFVTSDKLLVIAGRDATTNEMIIKKHTTSGDIVFHTDMAGSPFIVIKAQGQVPESSVQEATDFTAAFSRGWREGLATLAVFSVSPEQVTKQANTGEYLSKGAFVIRGKTTYHSPTMNYAIGLYQEKVMGGPVRAVVANCTKFVELVQGDDKASDLAKSISRSLGVDVDDVLRALPSGCKIRKSVS